MNTVVVTYSIYLVLSIALTVWVGRTLYRNGAHFLVDVFHGNKGLADAVNHLLVVGFYLVNLGWVSFSLRISDPPVDAQTAFEALSVKMGTVLIVLGVLHLFNVFVFNSMRNRANAESSFTTPPVNPDAQLTWTPPTGQA